MSKPATNRARHYNTVAKQAARQATNGTFHTDRGAGKHLLPGLVVERHKLYAERLARLQSGVALATPTRVTNSSTTGTYSGAELSAPAVRAGADDFLAVPSLIGGQRRWRDGRAA